MKRILILFGLLDFVTFIRSYEYFKTFLAQWTIFPLISAGNLLMYGSLIFSCYFLIRQNKIGLWLTYGQFPLRLLFGILSFGFLLTLSRLFDNEQMIYRILMWGLFGLEVIRLLLTVQVHKRYYSRTKPSLT